MDREPVASSNVVSIGYDSSSQTLEVEFSKSGIYQYYNVPEAIYEQLMAASSIGGFLNTNIKNSFSYSKI